MLGYSYKLIRSKRRSLALEVNQSGELIVRAPLVISLSKIRTFVNANSRWIEKHKTKSLQHLSHHQPKRFLEGEGFLFMGQEYALQYTDRLRPSLSLDGFFFLSKSKIKEARRIFEDWYRTECKIFFYDRLIYYSDLMKLEHRKLHITDARTRWGSCSHENNINFPWRLIMAPLEIIDYVIIHELSHIKHKNHSRDFWEEVSRIIPDYKIKRKWLRTEGHKLSLD